MSSASAPESAVLTCTQLLEHARTLVDERDPRPLKRLLASVTVREAYELTHSEMMVGGTFAPLAARFLSVVSPYIPLIAEFDSSEEKDRMGVMAALAALVTARAIYTADDVTPESHREWGALWKEVLHGRNGCGAVLAWDSSASVVEHYKASDGDGMIERILTILGELDTTTGYTHAEHEIATAAVDLFTQVAVVCGVDDQLRAVTLARLGSWMSGHTHDSAQALPAVPPLRDVMTSAR